MTTIKKLKREAQKLAEKHGHLMGNFRQTGKGSFQADCSECGESVQICHGLVSHTRSRKCPGMKIETTKDELISIFSEFFYRCHVPGDIVRSHNRREDLEGKSARDTLEEVISNAYSAGFLWARHQCGAHPGIYVIQPE